MKTVALYVVLGYFILVTITGALSIFRGMNKYDPDDEKWRDWD